MITRTGERVFTNNKIAPSMESVAVALSRIPRFCGHTQKWYSVFSHTMVVSALMVGTPNMVHGLLHDAPEAVVSDVPTPWKTVAAKKREKMLLRRIYRDLGIELPDEMEQIAVDVADRAALAAEAHVIGHPAAEEFWPNPDPLAVKLTKEELYITLSYIDNPQAAIHRWFAHLDRLVPSFNMQDELTVNV